MKNAGKACNNRLYRHIRTFEKIIKNYVVIYSTLAIRNMIRESKTHQLDAAIASGAAQGMRTMDMALADLVRQKRITEETALYYCTNYETMQKRLQLL